jgi:squid-like protein
MQTGFNKIFFVMFQVDVKKATPKPDSMGGMRGGRGRGGGARGRGGRGRGRGGKFTLL